MKRIILTFVAGAAMLSASAVPAAPGAQKAYLPDGTQLTVRICGDEFYGFTTTDDGYTVMRTDDGFFVYAQRINNRLEPSTVRAHDAEQRTIAEKGFLSTISPRLTDRQLVDKAKKSRAAAPAKASINYSQFRGLVILVNFNDLTFTRSDAQSFYSKMLNTEGYTGFTNENGTTNAYGRFTGSVRDYFSDNSGGLFKPQFDVVGPVPVNYSADDGNNNSYSIFTSAIDKVNSEVDFSQYDANNDGRVDLVYFIVAGSGSNSDSENPNHLWPYRSSMYKYVDGVRISDYACSTEYLYNKRYGVLDGIGTICHEFSHVLGLPDLYDTDYETNGQSQTPGDWEVMSGGSYQNNGRTPVAYSLYDRYAAGFNQPTIINTTGEYSLNEIGRTGEGFILKTLTSKEIFLIENRQNTRWDAYAPGHGMIIAHMDSTNASYWTSNSVNKYSNNPCYNLVRAGGGSGDESASDPFPGTSGITRVDNETQPANLLAKNGVGNLFGIYEISERSGVIYFKVKDSGDIQKVVETFEPMAATTVKTLQNVQGDLTSWNFSKSYATAPGADYCNGEKAIAILKGGNIAMAANVLYKAYQVQFNAVNSSSVAAKLTLAYSIDDGATWTNASASNGSSNVELSGSESKLAAFSVSINKPARFRIACTAGSNSKPVYIDDFTIFYDGEIDADSYGIFVAGTEVTSVNNSNVLNDGTVSFNPTTNVLTLNNANINCSTHGISTSSDYDLTINLIGTNTINSENNAGLLLYNNTIITGDTLLLNNSSKFYPAVNSVNAGNLTLQNCKLVNVVNGNGYGLSGSYLQDTETNEWYWPNSLIIDNSQVDINSTDNAINWYNELQLIDVSILTAGASWSETQKTLVDYNDAPFKGFVRIGFDSGLTYGDVNGDGEVTVGDVSAIYNIILGLSEDFRTTADINGDGEITVGDVSAIYNIILGAN